MKRDCKNILSHSLLRLCLGVLLLHAAACEKIVDFPVEESGRIHINAIVGDQNMRRIYINVSQPIEGEETVSPNDVAVEIEADGNPVEIEKLRYDESSTEAVFYTKETFHSGQHLTLKAEASGLPSVIAETVVPEGIPDVRIVRSANPLKCLFSIYISEELKPDMYFGVQVMKRTLYEYIGNVPESIRKQYGTEPAHETYDTFYENDYDMELYDLSSMSHDIYMDFFGKKMLLTMGTAAGNETLVKASVKPSERTLVQGLNSPNEEDNYEVYRNYEYRIILYRLSNEIYNHMKAKYRYKYSLIDPSLGFIAVTHTYTNIKGGFGVFGGISEYESEWSLF